MGRLGASAYCASKAGVVMFTKVLAMELAEHRINVNSVAPGVIEIPQIPQRAPRMNDEFRSALIQAIPWDGVGNPMKSPKLSFISVPRALSTLPGPPYNTRVAQKGSQWVTGVRVP
jgi:NAD(P)-dependent dehydrogenase (short-subunit alcohol dehydrogenase family)